MNINPLLRHALVALAILVGAGALQAGPTATPRPSTPPSSVSYSSQVRSVPVTAQTPVLVGGMLQDIVGNRSRLIQASFVAILIGIFILWKK